MVGELYGRCSYPSSCSQYSGIHRCLPTKNDVVLSGLWSNKESQLHINVLELKVVLLPLKGLQEHLQGQRVLICSENSTVVSYLNKERVVIPALTTMLDSSLVEEKSLCPVRALKVYLDKTKSMRKGKALLFVSLREGHTKGITRITKWIKRTIHTCYQFSDMTDQQVTHG